MVSSFEYQRHLNDILKMALVFNSCFPLFYLWRNCLWYCLERWHWLFFLTVSFYLLRNAFGDSKKNSKDGAEDQFYHPLFSFYYFLFLPILFYRKMVRLIPAFPIIRSCSIYLLNHYSGDGVDSQIFTFSFVFSLSLVLVVFLSGTLEGDQIGYFNSKEKNGLYSYICHFKYVLTSVSFAIKMDPGNSFCLLLKVYNLFLSWIIVTPL